MIVGGGGGSCGLIADFRPVDPYISERYESWKHFLGITNYYSRRLLSDAGAML